MNITTRLVTAVVAVAGSAFLGGCGGGGGGDDTIQTAVLQSISIAPAGTSTPVGQAQQFTATGSYSDGHTANVTAEASWSSTVPEVATINSQGSASGVAAGTTHIKATIGSISAEIPFNVTVPTGWTVEIHSPRDGQLVETTLLVAVSVQGPGEVTAVTAEEGGNSTGLAFFASHPQCPDSGGQPRSCWAGEIDLPATFGAHHRIVIRAQDGLGNAMAIVRDVVLDQAPVVRVDSPAPEAVGRPELQLDATCIDDAPSGCVSLTAAICGLTIDCSDPIAQGAGSIDTTVDLQAYNGRSRLLRFLATDTGGQQAVVFIPIFIEDSQHLQSIESVSGTILDADDTRVLHLNGATLSLFDRASGDDTDIQSSATQEPFYGFLTTAGAAFLVRETNSSLIIASSWKSGASVELGETNQLTGAGSYLLWSSETDLMRTNVDTETDELVSSNALNSGNSVIANGTVAFAERDNDVYNIAVLEAGATTPTFLTSDTTLANTSPRTDGTSFLYQKHEPCCSNVTFRLILNTNGSEQTLAVTNKAFFPDSGYQIAEGWVAYLKEGPSGVFQVWRIEPGEQPTQLSSFGTDSRIERLAADGAVIFVSGGRRYLVLPGETTPVDIGSDLGTSFFIDGAPHVAIGGTLFLVQ